MLLYLAVVVTFLTLAVLLTVYAAHILTRPGVRITGGHADDHPGIVTDADDSGVRVVEVAAASPFPLTWVDARYRLSLPEAGVVLDHATHAQVVDALQRADIDDATWSIGYVTPGALLSRDDWPVFVLTVPLVRRLTALEATITLRDSAGRTLTKTISALPKQPLGRKVTAAERARATA